MDYAGPGKIEEKLLEYNDDEKTLTIIYRYEGMDDDTILEFPIKYDDSKKIIKEKKDDIIKIFHSLDDDTAIKYIRHITTEENIHWCTICGHLHSSTKGKGSPITGHIMRGGGRKKKSIKSKTKKRCKKCRCQPCLCKKQIHCYKITCNTKRKSKRKSKKKKRKSKRRKKSY